MHTWNIVRAGNMIWVGFALLTLTTLTVESGPPALRGAVLAQEDTSSWVTLIKEIGFTGTLLLATAYGLARVAIWVSKEFLIPLRDSMVTRFSSFLTELEKNVISVKTTAESEKEMLAAADRRREEVWAGFAARLDRLLAGQDAIAASVTNWHTVCGNFHNEVRAIVAQEDQK